MPPSIPVDLVYNILDYLWGDPWTLLNCALTCRTWRDASRRLLKRGGGLQISDIEDLDRVARLVNSKTTRHFYQGLQGLYIVDDRKRPFMHIVPLRLPGALFPNVRILRLLRIDWASHRPHTSVFSLTTSFASVVDLSIGNSRFGTSADCRQFIAAFRNLSALELVAIRILTPVAGPRHLDLARRPHSSVKWLRLEALRLDAGPQRQGAAVEQLLSLNLILDLCLHFTSLTMLHIRSCTFRSFHDMQVLVCSFLCLRELRIVDVAWGYPSSRHSTLPLPNRIPEMSQLQLFTANVACSAHGDRLLEWLAASLPSRTLVTLNVGPCSTSLVGRTLRAIGGGLQRLTLRSIASEDTIARQIVYVYLSGHQAALQMQINVERDMPDLRLSCSTLLKGLAEFEAIDAVVRRVDILINAESRTLFTGEVFSVGASAGRQTSGNVTGRPVFASVERVTIDLKQYPNVKGTDMSTLQEATDGIRRLLSGWDACGLLQFLYPPWYSDTEASVGGLDIVDAGADVEDWEIWGDLAWNE